MQVSSAPSREVVARLRRVPALAEGDLRVEELPGGGSNRVLKVVTREGPCVARLFEPGSSALPVDRERELRNSVAAAAAGVGPAVLGSDLAAGVLVVAWVAGQAWTPDDVAATGNLARLAATCHHLHAGPAFDGTFDVFALQAAYGRAAVERGVPLPPGYERFAPDAERVRRALAVHRGPDVPCHNDLVAANVLDDDARLRLVDWEHAAMGDADFELGTIWAEAALPPERVEELVEAYAGRPTRRQVARVHLYGVVTGWAWAVWALVQGAVARGDHDFAADGLRRWDRAVSGFRGPAFAGLLEDAVGDD